MEDEIFLKKMTGVKPIKKDEKRTEIKYQKIKKTKTNKKKIIPKEATTIRKQSPKSEFNLSYGEINKDLKKGRVNIDRRLDLHGYTLLEAYDKFKNEVKKTYHKNKRCILVITGKGAYPNNQKEETTPKLFYGKIKNSIVSWIKEDDLKKYILTYQDAGFEHGGDGAIFVYLRKRN